MNSAKVILPLHSNVTLLSKVFKVAKLIIYKVVSAEYGLQTSEMSNANGMLFLVLTLTYLTCP